MDRKAIRICALVSSLAAGIPATASAEATSQVLSIELNKLEQAAEACLFYLIIENSSDFAFAKFTTELVFFDRSGVILSRFPLEFPRLRPNKNHVISFTLSPLNCVDVGRVLLNEITECEHTGETEFDCMDAVEVTHRGIVELVK